ncbi:MAG: ParM/StbA family protein [Aggregatilineales bacterium]
MPKRKSDQTQAAVVQAAPRPVGQALAGDVACMCFDLGNGFAKMLALLDTGPLGPIRWRSVQGRTGKKTRLHQLPPDWTIKWRGTFYVFGERAYTECSDSLEDFPTTDRYVSEWYKRMFAFGLYKAYGLRVVDHPGPYKPDIVASVPAKEFANEGRLNAIIENLCGDYQIETVLNTQLEIEVTEENLTVIPEGVGSFLYMTKRRADLERGRWGVFDAGYLTGDWCEFLDGTYVADSSDSDDHLGMITVSQRLADYIRGLGGPSVTAAYIDEFVNQECITINAIPYDVRDAYHEAMSELGSRIARFIERKGAGKNFAGILLTGGNMRRQAEHITLPRLPKPLVCDEPENGNLLGSLELAKSS